MVRPIGYFQWALLMVTSLPNWILYVASILAQFARSPKTFFKRDVRPLESFADPCALQHEYHQVNGIRLHVAVAGRDNKTAGKPLMLLVHGFPEAWFSWRHQLTAFQSSHEVAAVDLRGYGLSDKPPGRSAYRMHELVADIAELIPSLGHRSCVLVGHDWGGLIAWSLAAKHPDLLDKLVVLSVPTSQLFMRNMDAAQKKKSTYIWNFQLPILPELAIAADSYSTLDDVFVGPGFGVKTPGAITAEEIAWYKANLAQPGTLTAGLNYYRAMIDAQTWNPSPQTGRKPDSVIKVPTLVIGGKDDAALNPNLFRGLEEVVPISQLHILDNCSHWVQQDRPNEVNKLITQFLDTARDSRQTSLQ